MNILGMDTSSKAASCAFWSDGKVVAEFFVDSGFTHSQTIMPMLEAMLACSGTKLSDVDLYAVSAGPGSFTGLRIGLSAVKGMAMAAKKPCAPVSTLEGLAMNVCCFGGNGVIIPVMDARCSQVYTAAFRVDGDRVNRLSADCAMMISELDAYLDTLGGVKLLVGDGAKLVASALAHRDDLAEATSNLLLQRASSICGAAALMDRDSYVDASSLVPEYLRLPQAERELKAKHNNMRGMVK